jgi:type IV secretory pathway TrbF-like protein
MLLSSILRRRTVQLLVPNTALNKMSPFVVVQQRIGEARAIAGTAQSQTSAVRGVIPFLFFFFIILRRQYSFSLL